MTNKIFNIVIVIYILLAGIFRVNAQKYNFKNYTVVNGLGSSSVNNIFQDSRGYLWFATQGGGISRFNGKEFKNYTKKDGLIDNDVTFITEDKHGNIWIATSHGASLFNGSAFRNFIAKDGLSDGTIYDILVDKLNKVWFATKEAGVKIFDGKQFVSLDTSNGLPVNEVYSIAQSNSGIYWFGLLNGIAKYDGKNIINYGKVSLVKGQSFFSTLADNMGNVWFGSTSGSIIKIDKNEVIGSFELPENLKKDFIGCITKDNSDNIWFATDHGALKYNGKSFILYSEKEGLSTNSVQAISTDYESNIWIGTLGGGVNLLNSEAFLHYNQSDGLATNNVSCIYYDTTFNQYYIGTSGEGFYILDNKRSPSFEMRKELKALSHINISSISKDTHGLIWITAQEGVYILKRLANYFSLVNHYKTLAGVEIISPTNLIHDSKGNCWLSTYGSGLFELSKEGWRHYGLKNGLSSDNILTVFEDNTANIWIGTQDAGLIKYSLNNFETFSAKQKISDKAVWSITQDHNGHIFWGTGESGIYCFGRSGCYHYTTEEGLCSDFINSVLWDSNQNCLWLGSERGISKLQFTDQMTIKSIQYYNELNGFNPFGVKQNAILTDNRNLVWFCSASGLWSYNYKYYKPKNVPPKIQLAEIRLAYQKVDWKKYSDSIDIKTNLPIGLSLPYYNNHLTFYLQALTTDNVSYSYKLEGQDKVWSPFNKNSEIDFSNIEPGKEYTFKAKAVNSSGISGNQIIKFAFIVEQPWWKTRWFITTIITSLVGFIAAFIKTREKALIEQNLKLEKTVTQRTSEIAQQKKLVEKTLDEKQSLLEEKEILLKEIHHRVKNNLQTISSLLYLQSIELKDEESKKAVIESQNRVRSIALVHQKLYQTDGLEKVEFKAFASDLTKQIQAVYGANQNRVLLSWDIPETFLLIDTAVPLGLILNELLTNSFKYAFTKNPYGEIKMQLTDMEIINPPTDEKRFIPRRMKFTYWDNGPGLGPNNNLENASTLGLELIKLLSEQIGASISYSNVSGSEFSFIFEVNS